MTRLRSAVPARPGPVSQSALSAILELLCWSRQSRPGPHQIILQVVRLLLLSGADQTLLNADGKTALTVASCPNNPCTNPELVLVVRLLRGETPLEENKETTGRPGARTGLFQGEETNTTTMWQRLWGREREEGAGRVCVAQTHLTPHNALNPTT